jgi:hypothetical protein
MDTNKKTSEETSADVSKDEREILNDAFSSEEPKAVENGLDKFDEDGEPLNEAVDQSGEDLDIPGAEFDDDNEAIGEEDEENNLYSEADTE